MTIIHDVLLRRFVDFTDFGSKPKTHHRVYLSEFLNHCCNCFGYEHDAVVREIVDVAVSQIPPDVTFPIFLWSHEWHPFVSSFPNDDGRIALFLTHVNETSEGTIQMIEMCQECVRFEEMTWTTDGHLLRIFISEEVAQVVAMTPPTDGRNLFRYQIYLAAYYTKESDLEPFNWIRICGVDVC